MLICQNSEGVHPYLLKCCRGTCSFVGMLKGYMVRKRLGTPVPEYGRFLGKDTKSFELLRSFPHKRKSRKTWHHFVAVMFAYCLEQFLKSTG